VNLREKRSDLKNDLIITIFAAPIVAGIFLVSVLPTVLATLTSFTTLELSFDLVWKYSGLANYRDALANPLFLKSFRIGTIWAVSVTVLAMLMGFVLALLIERKKRYSGLLKFLSMFPWALSPVVVAIIWEILLNPNSGPINGTLRAFGLPWGNKSFLGDFATALPTVIVIGAWLSIPLITVSFISSLKTLRSDIMEAALMDGAKASQRLKYIVIPHLRPVTTSLFALNIIWNFNSFGLVYVLTNGGPGGQTYLPALFVYDESFRYGNFGYAAAMGTIITIALVVVLGFYVARRKKLEIES
jgi:multiple sugar transport system permease protein